MKFGENVIGKSGHPPFFALNNPAGIGLDAPGLRRGDALRTRVRSLSGFQKEAIVTSARTAQSWRLVSDEGPYLNGHDAAPCPLAFLTTGMIASYMNEIVALAKIRNLRIGSLRLTQNNYYTMKGSMLKRTMVGGALPVELQVEIDCDLNDADLNEFLISAVHASPLNGLMRGKLASLFALSRNGVEIAPGNAERPDGAILPDPLDIFSHATPAPTVIELVKPV
ncbi:MAG: OsmC family peroxiredoxin, partial [Paracoccaceae bacterium]